MTRESLAILNTMTLIGNTSARGTAWHYRARLQGAEPNHYPGPIPLADVRRRLFHWTAEVRPVAVEHTCDLEDMTHLDRSGRPCRWVQIDGRSAVTRSDSQTVLGVFTHRYTPHQYDEWLLATVAHLIGDDLSISSAGLLRGGAVAWVEVSVPQSLTTSDGVVFRPNLLATTSFDGSIATTFTRTITDTVCDNTRDAALAERGPAYRVRHTRHSAVHLASARSALDMLAQGADTFAATTRRLCATTVSSQQFERFLDQLLADDARLRQSVGAPAGKRDRIIQLYRHDPRVAPWQGTAHGVLQAVNTYEHHCTQVRRIPRGDRNMLRTLRGEFAAIDRRSWRLLADVLNVPTTC
jgi:phage/plasmid-like protein (TIGR03299 family)